MQICSMGLLISEMSANEKMSMMAGQQMSMVYPGIVLSAV